MDAYCSNHSSNLEPDKRRDIKLFYYHKTISFFELNKCYGEGYV